MFVLVLHTTAMTNIILNYAGAEPEFTHRQKAERAGGVGHGRMSEGKVTPVFTSSYQQLLSLSLRLTSAFLEHFVCESSSF